MWIYAWKDITEHPLKIEFHDRLEKNTSPKPGKQTYNYSRTYQAKEHSYVGS